MAESQSLLDAIQNSFSTSLDAFYIIPHEYHSLIDNESFVIYRSTTALSASSWMDIQFNVSTHVEYDTFLMLFFINNSGGFGQAQILEMSTGSSFTAGTSALAPISMNRNSTETYHFSVFSDPVDVSSTNINVLNFYFGSTGTPLNNGFQMFRTNDFIGLKQNSTYIVRMTNLSGNTGYASLELRIQEHRR